MSKFYEPSPASKSATFYDNLADVYEELDFKKKKGAKNLTGVEIEGVMPKEGEIRLLGNRNVQCSYYTIGRYSLMIYRFC